MKTEALIQPNPVPLQVIRHAQVCEKLKISSAKLFDMVARQQFPKPFPLVPGGRSVGWIEEDVNNWILARRDCVSSKTAIKGKI